MNFLDLINKTLLELNYKQVNSFSELVKNDHKRIKSILNIINREICNLEGWDFLLRKKKLSIPAHITELENTINGRILYLHIDGKRYEYCENNELFVAGHPKSCTFSSFANKLLFPEFDEDKEIDVVYYTNDCVTDNEGKCKENLTTETDLTLIPMPYAEQILVYGACLRMKANTEHFKFPYWQGMYNEALKNLKSKSCVMFKKAPQIKIHRQ